MSTDRPLAFTHESLPQRIWFGAGLSAEHLRQELEQVGAQRVMVIVGEHEAALASSVLGDLQVALRWTEVRQHVPVELADRATAAARESSIDLVVSVGGGSTTGLAKAVALAAGLPVVAVPTTYAGSEATDVWGLTEDGVKTTGRDRRVLPTAVVYDSALTLSLPVDLSVASGLNGLAHCVDSLWAPNADPINQALAVEGARALASGLPQVVADPTGVAGRDETLYGAYLAAVSFASAGSGMHHKICHVLGGAYDLPHAQTHAVVLPHVLAYNGLGVPEATQRLTAALTGEHADTSAVDALTDLYRRLGAPTALRDYGFAESDIPDAARRILPAIPPSNPAPVTEQTLADLLRAAWAGEPPQSLSRP